MRAQTAVKGTFMPSRWGPLLMPTSEERALLRLLAAGKTFGEAARALNLPPIRIECILRGWL